MIGGAALFRLWPRIMALAAAVVAEAVEAAGLLHLLARPSPAWPLVAHTQWPAIGFHMVGGTLGCLG